MTALEFMMDNQPHLLVEAKLLFRASAPKDNKVGLIITHSWRNSKDEAICADTASHFFNLGYAVLSFNLPGHSENDPLRNLCFTSAIRTVTNAASYMRARFNLDKLFGMGISLGSAAIGFNRVVRFDGQALLSYSPLMKPSSLYNRYQYQINAQRREIANRGYAVMESTSGRGSFEMGSRWIHEMASMADFYSEQFNTNPTPTVLIQGTSDERYDKKKYEAFASEHGAKFVTIPRADHNFTNPNHREKVITEMEKYFSSLL